MPESESSSPRATPLQEKHVAAGGRMVDFAGWLLPIQYESMLGEHRHCREATSLFDTSHMGQFLIAGPTAAEELSRALTQNAEILPVGRGKYGFLLNDAGGVIDDTILFRLGRDEFLFVVNAGPADGDADVMRQRLSKAKLTIQGGWGKLDVQGPTSRAALAPLVEADLGALPYFGCCRTRIHGRRGIVARSGYTGELGYEVFLPAEDLPALWDELVKNPDVKPAGLGARDSLRLEMAYPLYGHELSLQINPIEADLGRYVDPFGPYVGAEALRKVAQACLTRKLAALKSSQRRPFRTHDKIVAEGKEIGEISSGAFSPSLEAAVGMGFLPAGFADISTELIVKTARAEIPVTVVEKPFYKNGTCRKKQ
ncbi:MAG: glycine cleavage system aminomethyltransferase GcvT [Phycisphaerae bacterium]|nr:glycine cleavage system aminomethyltransferase GcvT [Phycisphaerae bacterium]